MPIEKLRPSFTFTEDRLKELQAVVPEAFADGKINWDLLREALGEYLEDESQEHFGLFWPGKREARRLAAMPSKGTLIPQPGQGVNEDITHNLFLEGDNQEVLKLLQKSYAGRIKMIYIDPPYNTGNDFVYPDDYREPLDSYLKRTGQTDESGQLLTTNSRASGRFHSNWLNMIYPRLQLARTLLTQDGVIFVSIDDNEMHNLRQIMNEVFGESNFIDCIVWKKRYGGGAKEKFLVTVHEYVLFYAKDVDNLDSLFVPQTQESIERYYKLRDDNFATRGPYRTHPLEATKSMGDRKNLVFPIIAPDGTPVMPKRQWLWSKERVAEAFQKGEIAFLKDKQGNWSVHSKQYLREETGEVRQSKAFSWIDDIFTQHGTNEILDIFGDAQVFSFPKPSTFVRRLVQLGTSATNSDIVIDFFSGSCAAAHAVLDQNREDGGNRCFIMVQIPEPTHPDSQAYKKGFKNIAEIGKERIRRVIKIIQADKKGKLNLSGGLDLGFRVSKLSRSHFTEWQSYTEKDVSQLEMRFTQAETPLVEGWRPTNLLIEILLLQGFPLDSRLRPLPEFLHNQVQEVTSDFCQHHLYVCLDTAIQSETVDAIRLRPEDVFVCLDSALSDEAKIILADRCNLKVI